MPKVTEAHVEARRQQILDAAIACFARNGFHQTSMQDICKEAALSAGAIYSYFPSKDEIIGTISEAGRQRTMTLIEAARAGGTAKEVFDRLADAFLSLAQEPACGLPDVSLVVQVWGEALRNPRVRQMLVRNLDEATGLIAGIIRQAQQRGEIAPAMDPNCVARALIAIYHGLLLQTALGAKPDIPGYVAAAKALVSGLFVTRGRPAG